MSPDSSGLEEGATQLPLKNSDFDFTGDLKRNETNQKTNKEASQKARKQRRKENDFLSLHQAACMSTILASIALHEMQGPFS